MSKPHIILTSKFTYAAIGQSKNDYGRYATSYMSRKAALEKRAYLTPEEETELLQREVETKENSRLSLFELDSQYSVQLKTGKLAKANKTELDKASFVSLNNEDYGKYIGYMMRKQALAAKKEKEGLTPKEKQELVRVAKGAAQYDMPRVGKDKVLQGYFSCDQDTIRLKDLNAIREKMRAAQANQSILWQDVISFDNEYLREMGVFDPTTGYLDEDAIRTASTKMMAVLSEDEKLNNPYWTASIHRNTDNIHIHFGIVEAANSRPIIEFIDKDGVRRKEPKGRRKQATLEHMKHAFTSSMFNTTDLLKEMNLRRNEITKAIASELDKTNKDLNFQKQLNEFVKTLPEEKSKWRWANLNTEQRSKLTNLVDLTMKDNKDYQKWDKLFKKYQTYYEDMYGHSAKEQKNNAAKKWDDMKRRSGNALLKQIKDVDDKVHSVHSDYQKAQQSGTAAKLKDKIQSDNLKVNGARARLSYEKRQKLYKESQLKGQKKYRDQREFDQKLKQTIRPVFSKKASNQIYKTVQRNLAKNLTTFEKAQALTDYEQMQRSIEVEQAER